MEHTAPFLSSISLLMIFAIEPVVVLDIYENLCVNTVLAEGLIKVADLEDRPRTFHLDFTAKKAIALNSEHSGASNPS